MARKKSGEKSLCLADQLIDQGRLIIEKKENLRYNAINCEK